MLQPNQGAGRLALSVFFSSIQDRLIRIANTDSHSLNLCNDLVSLTRTGIPYVIIVFFCGLLERSAMI
jgi:hypothetical protein